MKVFAATILLAGAVSALPSDLAGRAIVGPTRNYNCDGKSQQVQTLVQVAGF
jgi:hypothetical protein